MTYPWEVVTVELNMSRYADDIEFFQQKLNEVTGIPAFLLRDANNRAPWMNLVSPAKAPQASPTNWAPPSAANSPPRDA